MGMGSLEAGPQAGAGQRGGGDPGAGAHSLCQPMVRVILYIIYTSAVILGVLELL